MKKLLLFVIACTLGLFGTLRAQDDVVTIGGDATKESSVFPIPTYYGQSLSQTLYTASAINHAPATITSIAFKKASDDAVRNLTVYLKNTDKETLSGWEEFSDTDKVYTNASLTTSSVDGWMTLELDTEFEYTGGGIIVIAWDRTGSTSYKSGCMYTDIGSNIALYNTNSTLTEDNYLTYSPSVSTRQPSIQFAFQNITDDLEPATPTGLAATVNDYKSISLSWNEAENAKGYNVYKNGEKIAVTGGTSYNVDGLEQTTAYCFTVTAIRGAKESAASEEVCATTEAFDGCFVDFLLSDSYGDGWTGCSINLTFSNGQTESLTITNGGKTEPVVFTLAIPKGLVTITFTSVSYASECSYVAKYTDGETIYTSGVGTGLETSFTVDCGSAEPTPVAPATPVVEFTATETTVTLTWEAVDGATEYNIYTPADFDENVLGLTETTYTFENLTAATEYCFQVSAVNDAGESDVAEVCVETEAATEEPGEGGEGTTNTIIVDENATAGVSTPDYPVNINYEGAISQVIYTAEELNNTAGTITSISYNVLSTAYLPTDRSWVVYVQNTDKGAFSSETDWMTLSADDIVYEGTVTVNTGWVKVEFTTPFEYTGGNLMVCIHDKTNAYVNAPILSSNYSTGATRRSIAGFDYAAFDAYSIPEGLFLPYLDQTDFYNPLTAFEITAGGEGGGEDPTPDPEPVVEGYRLEAITQASSWNNISYVYESETSHKVIEVREGEDSGYGQYIKFLQYNADGTLAGYEDGWAENGSINKEGSSYQYTAVEYTYTDGVVTSYTETQYTGWSDPSSTEYTITRDAEGNITEVAAGTSKFAYTYENGKLASETKSYYDSYYATYVTEYIIEYAYDANGNCTVATQYSAYDGEKVARKATEYSYDLTISSADVTAFAYPDEVKPANANLITRAISYEFQEDWQTGEIYSTNYTVQTYVYNPAVVVAPLAPMNLTAQVLSDEEISLSWTSLENGTTFTIYNGTEVVAEGVTETMYTVEGLTAATEYCFTVVSVNGEKVSEASNEACAETMNLVNVQPSEIAFGEVRLGNYWSEYSSAINVTIDPLGKEITAVESDNAFFRIPANIDLTGDNVVFSVNYNKSAEAGEYTGNLKVTLSTGTVVTVPMTATAYTPVTPDLFELATEVEFTEGAYENTPDFATLKKDYNLPNATENNPDAVYAFELAEDAVVTASVSANGIYAIYTEDFSGEDGPLAENAFYGNEVVLGTSFSYDFENGMADFTIEDNDGNTEYTWAVEEGALKSYSYKGGYDDNGYWATFCSKADERAITNGSYAITANTVLTFDAKFIDSYGYGVYDEVTVEVTDGESYTEIETLGNSMDPITYYPIDGWKEKRVDLGAKFAELGLAYGDYQLVFRHNVSGVGSTQIDNISLTERVSVYPAGKYYLVASAAEAFTVNISYEVLDAEPEVPVAKEYRLESIENIATTVYTYDEVYTNRVVSYEQEGFTSTLSYNTNGQLVTVVDTYPGEDEDGNPTIDVINTVTYTYNADGTIATHSEESAGWAPMTTEYVYAEGKLVSTILADYEMETEFVYNAEGLLSEKVTSYYGEVDSKEVYTYDAEGRVVDYGYYYYDAYDLQDYYLAEGVAYTYDENGDCALAKSYQVFEGEKSYYQTVEYFYDATIANEKVYSFELPHVAATNVAPAHVSVLAKELSYYTEYTDNGDAVNHTYILTVYNYNPAVVLAPIAPMNLTAEVVEGTVTLTWEAFADAETFTVYQGETVVAENIEESTYEITGLAAGEYCYTVKAVNVKGESTASNTACVTIEGAVVEAPAAPENLVATVTGATTITLTWDAVEGATSYNVYGADAVIVEGLTETTYVVEDLAAETAYCFTVTAVGEGGESEKSNEACATTEPDGIAENEATFSVYPNPAENVVFVETASNIEAVSIYNITGVMIYSEEGAMNNVQINVADFSAGVYVMKVRTENGEVVKHFVKK